MGESTRKTYQEYRQWAYENYYHDFLNLMKEEGSTEAKCRINDHPQPRETKPFTPRPAMIPVDEWITVTRRKKET
jgi:hypothetical protein